MNSVPKKTASPTKRSSVKNKSQDSSVSAAPDSPTAQAAERARESTGLPWTYLTNHAHVLVLLARNPSLVLREVALQVGITERAVQRIISDLEATGVLEREKIGRQNHYRINADQPLRHPIESHRTIGDLLVLINDLDQ